MNRQGSWVCVEAGVKNISFLQDETVWRTQKAMAELFGVKIPAISKHLSNIFESGELQKEATLSKLDTVQKEGTVDGGSERGRGSWDQVGTKSGPSWHQAGTK